MYWHFFFLVNIHFGPKGGKEKQIWWQIRTQNISYNCSVITIGPQTIKIDNTIMDRLRNPIHKTNACGHD